MGSGLNDAGSTREQVPSTVEEIRKHFWAEKVDIWKNEATGRGPVDGVWFAENGMDAKGNERSKTVVFLFLHGGAYRVGKFPFVLECPLFTMSEYHQKLKKV